MINNNKSSGLLNFGANVATALPSIFQGIAGLWNNAQNRRDAYYNNRQMQSNFYQQMAFNARESALSRNFNSVGSLVNQYKLAGLDPNEITSAGGSPASASAGDSPNFDTPHTENPFQGFAQGVAAMRQTAINERAVESQTEKNAADANLANSEAKLNQTKDELTRQQAAESESRVKLNASQSEVNDALKSYYNSQDSMLNQMANYYSKLAGKTATEDNLLKIQEKYEDVWRRSMIEVNNKQASLYGSQVRLNNQEFDLAFKVNKYIVKGYELQFNSRDFDFYDPARGTTLKMTLSPYEMKFYQDWMNYVGSELSNRSASYGVGLQQLETALKGEELNNLGLQGEQLKINNEIAQKYGKAAAFQQIVSGYVRSYCDVYNAHTGRLNTVVGLINPSFRGNFTPSGNAINSPIMPDASGKMPPGMYRMSDGTVGHYKF